jgi:TolB-like protein
VLAAILYADVAGYSRLTGEDEDATHRTLSEYLDLLSSMVESHRGRVMHYAGNAVLAMFDAVIDALACASAIQEDLKTRSTELSRFPNLFVIARHSSFAFRAQTFDVKEIGGKLGVRYIVEGSVRTVGKRMRITAQLIDVATGNHIWAERYDRAIEDIFDVQDEVSNAIVATQPGQIEKPVVERGGVISNRTVSLFPRARWN